MDKKRVIKSIENISEEVMEAIKKKYPDGWANHVQRIDKGNGDFMHVITVDTADASYLIKVKVKVDTIEEVEKFTKQVNAGDDVESSSDVETTDEVPDVEDTEE